MTATDRHRDRRPRSEAGNPIGFGRMLRKEDARFLRGQGNYVDDIQLPGMLHGAILRSPFAHARIVSIDTSAAEAHPKVKAVITGATLEGLGLAWMPTLSNDVQAVLATDKVRFQGQEVAFVVAEDRYAARDALELIDVDYEPLDPVVDARRALDDGAPVIRDDIEGKADNHIFDWESGDKARCDEVFAGADVVVSQDILYPRSHPAPLETCGSVAHMDKVTGKLTAWITSQAPARPPHRLRPGRRPARAQDPGDLARHRRRLRQQGADLPRLRAGRRGLDRHRQAGEVGRGPIGEPHVHRVRPRLPHARRDRRDPRRQDPRPAGRRDRRPRRVQRHSASRRSTRPGSSTSSPAATTCRPRTARSPASTPTRRRAAWPTPARSASPRRSTWSSGSSTCLADELGMDPAELRMQNLLRPEQFPYTTQTGWEYDSGDYPRALQLALELAGYDELRREQAEKRERGELMGIGLSFFTEGVGAGPRKHMDILGLGMADGCELRVHPTGKAVVRLSVQTQGQGHETTFAQIVVQPAGHPARGHRGGPRRHRPDAVRARHLRLALDAGVGGGRRRGGPAGAGQGPDRGGRRARVLARRPRVGARPLVREGRPVAGQDDPGDRPAGPQQPRAARGGRGPPRRHRRLQPAQPDLPVRRLPVRRRRRPGHRAGARCGGSWPSTTAGPASTR